MQRDDKIRYWKEQKLRVLVWYAVIGLVGGTFLVICLMSDIDMTILCENSSSTSTEKDNILIRDELQLDAIRHYATSKVVPQQSFAEITVAFDVLKSLGRPANFLVFGLGRDSLMWASLNPRGTTLFLEEDPHWVQTVLTRAPSLNVHTVKYRTRLSEASELMKSIRGEPACSPTNTILRGNKKCKLALDMLADEVYDKEWDLIMIDAPRGYFPDAPGRMAAIYSAAVMARNRKAPGVTHVFLHDIDRQVERTYGRMILCKDYLVHSVGKLWHFQIPPASKISTSFC